MMTNFSHSRFSSGAFLALILLNLALLLYLGFGTKDRPLGPPQGQSSGPHAPSRLGKFLEKELQLRPEQVSQFEGLKKEHFQTTRKIRQELRKSRGILFNSLTKPSEEIDSLSQQIGNLQQELEQATYEHFAKLRSICDPSQQQKLDTMVKDLLTKMAPPGPHGPPRHGGPPPGRKHPPTPRPSSP